MTVGALALRSTISFSTKNTIGHLPPHLLPGSPETSRGVASPACRIPPIEFHVEFVPEGRRPRRLVAPPDINHIETVVPTGTEAGAPP